MTQALAGFEPKYRDVTPDRSCLGAIIAVSGEYLLGEPVQARVLVGISNFGRHELLAGEFAFRMCFQVVIPLRVSSSAVVGRNQDRVGPIVEVGQLHFSRLTRFGTFGERRCRNTPKLHRDVSAGRTVQPRIDASGSATRDELP